MGTYLAPIEGILHRLLPFYWQFNCLNYQSYCYRKSFSFPTINCLNFGQTQTYWGELKSCQRTHFVWEYKEVQWSPFWGSFVDLFAQNLLTWYRSEDLMTIAQIWSEASEPRDIQTVQKRDHHTGAIWLSKRWSYEHEAYLFIVLSLMRNVLKISMDILKKSFVSWKIVVKINSDVLKHSK